MAEKIKNSTLNENEIKNHLTVSVPLSFEIFDSISSTNLYLMQNRKNLSEFTIAIANSQTNGIGRMGRSFFSPNNSGIYFSILLKPEIKPQDALLITPLAAVCVCKSIEKISDLKPKIKWVNDVFLNGKKVCGILTQSSITKSNMHCVLGVGINLSEPKNGFPDELKNIAGSVFDNGENFKNKIIAEFFNCFFDYYTNLTERKFFEEYKKRCFILGKRISFEKDGKKYFATANDIDENFNLCVLSDNDVYHKLSAGEISIKM